MSLIFATGIILSSVSRSHCHPSITTASVFNASYVDILRGELEYANKPDELEIAVNMSVTVALLLRRKYGNTTLAP